jgi:hypothetical protein
MRKWGAVITLFYALVILALLVPGAGLILASGSSGLPGFYDQLKQAYSAWGTWVAVAILILGQAMLPAG